MIDAHIHADTRPYEDFEIMAIAGVEKAVTCAHDPMKMSYIRCCFRSYTQNNGK